MIVKYLKAGLVPFLKGSPGMGKSELIKKIAELFGLLVIDFRLAQCDPTDLLGFPHILGNKATYIPMATFPLEDDPIPDGYNGWLLFFDEANSASNAVQAAMYKIVLDRQVGQDKLHKNVAMVMAGNLETDGAIVNPMSTAMQSRVMHMELIMDSKGWIDWANDIGMDHRITAYIGHRPDNLYTFSPDHQDETYACGRTWFFADKILKVTEEGDRDRLPMLAGAITEGMAREFLSFCEIYKDLVKIADIEKFPESVPVPGEPSILYALTGELSVSFTKANADNLIKYINRLPKEFQVICLRETVRRNKAIRAEPAIQKWVAEAAEDLYD